MNETLAMITNSTYFIPLPILVSNIVISNSPSPQRGDCLETVETPNIYQIPETFSDLSAISQ